MRELARLALSDRWNAAEARAALDAADPAAAADAYQAGLTPLAEAEPEFDGPGAMALRDWLRPIGMKIAPNMPAEICATWLTAMVMALSDFPARIAAQAARTAIRVPMSFLNEVDLHVRTEAEALMARHRTALLRLRTLGEELHRAATPQNRLPPPAATSPMSAAELRALSPPLRRIGLSQGWISQDQLDAADAADPSTERNAA